MKISICTQLMEWNFGLREALPTWFKLPYDEIVIFDFNSEKENAKEIVDLYPDKKIKLLFPKEKIPYNMPKGRNIAINASKGDLIINLDSDVKVKNNIDLSLLNPNLFMQGCKFTGDKLPDDYMSHKEVCLYHYLNDENLGYYWTSVSGSCIFYRDQFNAINGYDERMKGPVYQDYDFYFRLARTGYQRIDFPEDSLRHVNHSMEERVKNFPINVSEIGKSNDECINISKDPWCHRYSRDRVETYTVCDYS